MSLTAAEALALSVQARTSNLEDIYYQITSEANQGNSSVLLDVADVNPDTKNQLEASGYIVTYQNDTVAVVSWAPTS